MDNLLALPRNISVSQDLSSCCRIAARTVIPASPRMARAGDVAFDGRAIICSGRTKLGSGTVSKMVRDTSRGRSPSKYGYCSPRFRYAAASSAHQSQQPDTVDFPATCCHRSGSSVRLWSNTKLVRKSPADCALPLRNVLDAALRPLYRGCHLCDDRTASGIGSGANLWPKNLRLGSTSILRVVRCVVGGAHSQRVFSTQKDSFNHVGAASGRPDFLSLRSHLDIQRQVLADTSRQPAEAIRFVGDLKVKGAPGKPVPEIK